jgi:hypothetical protein
LLSTEELLAMVEPVDWVVEAVVCRELQLVQVLNGLAATYAHERGPERAGMAPEEAPMLEGNNVSSRPP